MRPSEEPLMLTFGEVDAAADLVRLKPEITKTRCG
jgi:hypothetical protein